MAVDRHIVPWVAEHEVRLLVAHESGIARLVERVAAKHNMIAEVPEVAA